MQQFNLKELQECHNGTTEIQKIMYGSSLVWENYKLVDLGTAQTFDVKNYTDNWRNLTANNFFIIGNSNTASISGSDSDSSYINYVSYGYTKSYNNTTGILEFYIWIVNSHWDRWGYAPVHVAMVEKREKLISLGAITSFNARTYPNYADFTWKNFLMLRPNLSSGEWKQIGGVRPPYNWNATAQISSSYSSGVFNCQYTGIYNHENYDSGTPRTVTLPLVTYLFPKKIV